MILVTGDKGFIGTYLSKKLTNYIGLDLKDGQDILNCDLPKDIELIYHLAAQSKVIDSISDPQYDAVTNIIGTIRIARAYPNAKIIYSASGGTSLDIQSPYGLSKHTAGEYLKLIHKNYVICNLPNVFNHDDGRVLSTWLKADKIVLYGNGLQTRDFVHVDDIVDGLLKAQDWPVGEYYLGSNQETKLIDIAKTFGKKIEFSHARKGECLHSKVPNTTPNWTPKVNILDYICQLQS